MGLLQKYIEQQKGFGPSFPDQPISGASIFVVIPCYNEPDIVTTLNSIASCYPPHSGVSVLVVVNDADNSSDEVVARNRMTIAVMWQWKLDHPLAFFDLIVIYARALPQKWAGVGWARKIGMDEVVRQLVKNDRNDAIIVSFDADSTVMPNYLQAIESAFDRNPNCDFFTIHFEHLIDLQGITSDIREGIIRYELHMRYFRNAMLWIGYPHAIHTVGSSFAVKATSYVKQGGMNRRKAGEDFYFLHKLILLGQYGNISSTTVFPAARESDRVPFGTGAALKKWIDGSADLNFTYSLEPFFHLKPLFVLAPQFWQMNSEELDNFIGNLHPSLHSFCISMNTLQEITELKKNCSNSKVFGKRIFHLLNAFWILKYINFAHEKPVHQAELRTESARLLQILNIQTDNDISLENLLYIFRNLDKNVENCG